jgi:hypothetical protein
LPIKSGRLTDKEEAFVQIWAATGDAVEAERRAGYVTDGRHQVMRRPQILARREELIRQHISGVLLPKALTRIEMLLDDPRTSGGIVVASAKMLLGAHIELSKEDSLREKDPSEMTAAELAARIDELSAQSAALAKEVRESEAKAGLFE